MALFFRGAITSSPIKTRKTQEHDACCSFDTSFLSDTSYECLSVNPATGSLCVCRRSPRLLANGYYVLTEDSVATDDEGNLTLTPTQTNISYKENLARIFRRRRKVRRSLATLLSDVSQSCQSWLGGSVFGRANSPSHAEPSSWLDISSCTEQDTPIRFTFDCTETIPPANKETFLPEVEPHTEVCTAEGLQSQTLTCLHDVPPTSKCLYKGYSPPTDQPLEAKFINVSLFIILILCIYSAVFYRSVLGGIAVSLAFLFYFYFICVFKSRRIGLSLTKTEDITSRNE
ncbi:transmembrane protein 71 [Trichomycterus rosablanca]|uniref:transmembrane protein 71 n=1 Tax=Trichomycterus rosablanca TaxID=2290929 RepID=UPI002F356421